LTPGRPALRAPEGRKFEHENRSIARLIQRLFNTDPLANPWLQVSISPLHRTGVVLHAVSDSRKPMDLRSWPGANHSDAQWHREDLQRRRGCKDAVLCRE
jgi:hypothetical protein